MRRWLHRVQGQQLQQCINLQVQSFVFCCSLGFPLQVDGRRMQESIMVGFESGIVLLQGSKTSFGRLMDCADVNRSSLCGGQEQTRTTLMKWNNSKVLLPY
jgi:hypothetical protein